MKKIKILLFAFLVVFAFAGCDVMKLLMNPQSFASLGGNENEDPFTMTWDFSVYSDGEEIGEGWDGLHYTYYDGSIHCGRFDSSINSNQASQFSLTPERSSFLPGHYDFSYYLFENSADTPLFGLRIYADGSEIYSEGFGDAPDFTGVMNKSIGFQLAQEYDLLSFVFLVTNTNSYDIIPQTYIYEVSLHYEGGSNASTTTTSGATTTSLFTIAGVPYTWDFNGDALGETAYDGWSNLTVMQYDDSNYFNCGSNYIASSQEEAISLKFTASLSAGTMYYFRYEALSFIPGRTFTANVYKDGSVAANNSPTMANDSNFLELTTVSFLQDVGGDFEIEFELYFFAEASDDSILIDNVVFTTTTSI